MDTSSSSEELSSSECEIESSCEDDSDKLETAKICGATLQLPQGLCESKDIFKEFFSQKTWNSLSEINKQHLKNFLPCFPENDEQEKNATLQKLFNRERFRFNSPLMHFQEKLKAGHFRPDISKMRSLMKQAQRKECKYQQERYYKRMFGDLVKSRRGLLDLCNSLPPGVEPRVEKPAFNNSSDISPAAFRAKRRYFQELAAIKALMGESVEWSEDENYPEGPPVQLSKKQRRHLNGLQGSATLSPGVERTVTSTLSNKPTGMDLEYSVTSTYNPYQLNEDSYRALLSRHKKRKLEFDSNPELITKGINVRDIAQRTQLTPTKKSNGKPIHVSNNEHKTSKKKIKVEPSYRSVNRTTSHSPEITKTQPTFIASTAPSSNSEPDYSDSDSFIDPVMSPVPAPKAKSPRARTPKPKQTSPRSSKGKSTPVAVPTPEFEPIKIKTEFEAIKIKTEPEVSVPPPTSLSLSTDNLVSPISQFGNRIVPATLSDLDGIDMMNLPVDLDDSNIDILEEITVKQELMQDTHANFLSLIRDIICSTMDHRMSLLNLEDRLKAWQENPISPLNDWYSLVDNWVSLLPSAINFLTGESNEQPEDFVPYLEYKPMLQAYQWIGAGRDSDNLLSPLCQYWLEHRDDTIVQSNSQDIEIDVVEKPQTPPPPRCPTQWSVRKAEPEEVEMFREQERQRYSNPHKAFTYRMNGYESVVGPVKGMYNQSAGVSKARGHSMLNADRPNFVTILTLVRDATARLPNGEGTRAEICELLKSSQYISQSAPENVLQSVVSGALDRMHTEFDPCVKYDTKRKIWIYLHRNRSEVDFERIHQQCQGMSKQLKKASRKNKAKPKQEKAPKQTAKAVSEVAQPVVTATTTPAVVAVPEKPAKPFKTPVCRVFTVPTASSTSSTVQNPTLSPSRQAAGTSLLVNSNISALKPVASPKPVTVQQQIQEKPASPIPVKTLISTQTPSSTVSTQQERQIKIVTSTIAPTKQDIEEAIQTLTPIRVASPITKQISAPKPGKSLVKIINSPQGKSLISPVVTGSQQQQTVFIKQVEQKTVGAKQLLTQPQITQQLLQSIAAQQQKQLKTAQQVVQINQQKQITVTTQQILKTIEQKPVQTIAPQQIIQTVTHPPQTTTVSQASISQQLLHAINQQKQNQTTLTTAQQQQQILQTIKQKVAQQNQQTVLTVQQAVLKQQANMQQLQKLQQQQQQQQQIAKGTSLLGQQRILTQVGTAKTTATQNQQPLVAKVLTNAAGQVISVESLLAHQKQHGTLPQGTTLRVSGSKPGQTNLIQLSSSSSANQMTQFAVVSQNNIVSIAGQQRLISTVTCQPSATTSTVTVVTAAKALTKNHIKPQTTTKFVPSKLTHQLVNAKFITQNVANSKLLPQQKIVVNQQNQIKINATAKSIAVTKTVASSNQAGNTVRMVNAAGLNLAHIAGKPILLASKGNTIQNLQGQNIVLQAQPSISTSSGSIVLPNNARVIQGTNVVTQQSQSVQQSQANAQVVLGTQLKVQNVNQNLVQTNASQVVLGHNIKPQNTVSISQPTQNQTVMLGGHTIKMQAGTQSNQRVVLASQGQGGQLVAQQILLPTGFQGGAINIKTLQGLKVIPLAQTQQTKGRPQQVFARIMNPAAASRITHVTSTQSSSQLDGGGNQTNAE